MKKFIAGLLAAALIFTSADFSVFEISAKAAAAVTDAYDAWEQLDNVHFSTLEQAVVNANGGERDNEQNLAESRYKMIFGPAVGGRVPDGGVWGIKSGITTSGSYSTPAVFNQTGIDGTAQVKAGQWLNDTTYDATAGVPTTENLFVNVGGTQYLVDITYEYVYRP